jgi:dihydroneopterin aldolase
MDIIYLHHLTIDTVIGVWEWERRIRQTLIMDLELGVDATRAGRSDAIADTVDYQAVTDRVLAFAAASEFHLIEALAEHIAQLVLSEFGIEWIRVRVNKQGVVEHVRDVGIIVERSRRA